MANTAYWGSSQRGLNLALIGLGMVACMRLGSRLYIFILSIGFFVAFASQSSADQVCHNSISILAKYDPQPVWKRDVPRTKLVDAQSVEFMANALVRQSGRMTILPLGQLDKGKPILHHRADGAKWINRESILSWNQGRAALETLGKKSAIIEWQTAVAPDRGVGIRIPARNSEFNDFKTYFSGRAKKEGPLSLEMQIVRELHLDRRIELLQHSVIPLTFLSEVTSLSPIDESTVLVAGAGRVGVVSNYPTLRVVNVVDLPWKKAEKISIENLEVRPTSKLLWSSGGAGVLSLNSKDSSVSPEIDSLELPESGALITSAKVLEEIRSGLSVVALATNQGKIHFFSVDGSATKLLATFDLSNELAKNERIERLASIQEDGWIKRLNAPSLLALATNKRIIQISMSGGHHIARTIYKGSAREDLQIQALEFEDRFRSGVPQTTYSIYAVDSKGRHFNIHEGLSE